MTAQPVPMPVQIEGGIDTTTDDATGARPSIILNAHYTRTGALSKRNGYDSVSPVDMVLPNTPLPGGEDGYLAFDGDKFFARKSRKGIQYYERPDGRLIGEAGVHRPELTQLPAAISAGLRPSLLCDVAMTGQAFNSWSDSDQCIFYVRLEMANVDPVLGDQTFDIVIDYISRDDARLTLRLPTRIKNAVVYKPGTRQQLRALVGRPYTGAGAGIILVYTTDRSAAPGSGLYYRQVLPASDPTGDVIMPEYAIVTPTSTPQLAMTEKVYAIGTETPACFDADTLFADGGLSVAYASQSSSLGLAWARVRTSGNLTASTYQIHTASFQGLAISIAITGVVNGSNYEVVYSYVSHGAFTEGFCGKFTTGTTGAPANQSAGDLITQAPADTNAVGVHSAVAGRFTHWATGSAEYTFFAGVNSGIQGFRFAYHDLGGPGFYLSQGPSSINCAWATGRPWEANNESGDWIRVFMPMVSWGGELGGGTGLFVDITPPATYKTGTPKYGAKLMATFAVDQVALVPIPITATVATLQSWKGYLNGRLMLRPSSGSHMDPGYPNRTRWLTAVGHPATPVLLKLTENTKDFEFLEPGVMITGPGVPVMLDAINGLSELGFHASPAIMSHGGNQITPAGDGWALNQIVQYRFQYRFVDGLGRAQVSPASEPYQMTAPVDGSRFGFSLAALDVTLRDVHVYVDVYRTDPNEATFYFAETLTAEGGERRIGYTDKIPVSTAPLDRAQTINLESYWMTPPCANHAFRGAFRDVLVTRENELWPSNRRLSTTAPQFDIVNSGAWDSYESVVTGGEIDGKLILFSKSKIAYSYEMNGVLAPFTDIPSDTGALDGSRAFSTHLGVFYQSTAGIRVIGRDMAIHETGLPIQRKVQGLLVRGGIRVSPQGEIRLRLEGGANNVNYYLVFDYFHGTPDQPVWYEYRYDDGGLYTADDGLSFPYRQFVDQVYGWDGRLMFLCRAGYLLFERPGWYRDLTTWVPMIVRSNSQRGRTAVSYLATIEGVVNLERNTVNNEPPPIVTLRLLADYEDSIPAPRVVTKQWLAGEIESHDRRQIQITSSPEVMNAPAISLEYDDTQDPSTPVGGDGFGYRLSAMVMVYAERDQKVVFPVANGARK